ncbi:MAG: hypothetical protein J5838_00950 [Desulfovibrio sp.]|nr:hypothetical protein [Desulfovibrio sp.]
MYTKVVLTLMAVFLSINTALAKPIVSDVKEYKNHGEIDKIQCDETNSIEVKLGDVCNFYVDFSTKNNKTAIITDINYWFWADKDYNGDDKIFSLNPTKEIEASNWTVKNEKMMIAESTDYKIKSLPDKSSDENIIFKSEILYKKVLADGSVSSDKERTVQCVRVRVKK